MDRKILLKTLLVQFLLNIPFLVFFICATTLTEVNNFFMFVVSATQLIGNITILIKLKEKLFSLPVLFLALSYLFHFGQLVLTAFNIKFGKNVLYPLWYVSQETYNKSFIFTYLVQYMVCLGIILILYYFKNKKNRRKIFNEINVVSTNRKIVIIGWIFILIGIIPTIYIEGSKLLAFLEGGYIALYELSIRDFIQVIANCVNFGFLALIIGYSQIKWKANTVFAIAIIFKIVQMMSGGRGEAMTFLIALIIVWSMYVYEMKIKDLVILGLVGFLFLILINFLASFRVMEINFQNFVKAFGQSLKSNQIVGLLSEFGSTFATVCFAMLSFPNLHKPTWGLNYLLPIVYVLPNLGGFNQTVVNLSIFSNHLNTFNQPIGGSYVGELFYSFNWLGIVFAIFIGAFVGFIACKIHEHYNNNNFKCLLYLQTIPYILFWVRGYFGALYRGIIWHGILAILIWLLLNSKYVKEKRGVFKWLKLV